MFALVAGVALVPAAAPAPTLILKPTCGPIGTTVQVHGSGFQAPPTNNDVNIYFGVDPNLQPPPPPTLIIKAGEIKADGTFDTNLPVNAPNRGAPYQVTAIQNVFAAEFVQNKATASFQVPCTTLTLNPTCGSVGGSVAVRGSGFQPGLVTIMFTPSATGKPDGAAEAGRDTTFAITVMVPQLPPGSYVVEATQTAFATAVALPPLVVRAPFTIPCVKAAIVLKPAVGPPGTVTMVTGTGFPVGAVVRLTWSQGIPLSQASITIGSGQGFQLTLLIYPHDQLGLRHLNAGPDLKVTNAPLFNIATADFLVVPGSAQPRDFSWRR